MALRRQEYSKSWLYNEAIDINWHVQLILNIENDIKNSALHKQKDSN